MGAGTIGDVSEDLGPVLELNPIDAVGKRLYDDPLHEWGALGHERQLYQTSDLGYLPAWAWPFDAPSARRFAAGSSPCEEEPSPFVSSRPAVRIKGPLSVIATVCSK